MSKIEIHMYKINNTNLLGWVTVVDHPTPTSGLIYPKKLIERIISDAQPKIAQKSFLGEYGPNVDKDHPASISIVNVSHIIEALYLDGDSLMAEARLLSTIQGMKVAKVEQFNKLKFSMRGVGSVRDGVVQDDYHLVAIDIFLTI